MGLMVLENRPPLAKVVLIWAMSIVSNSLLYAVIALLLWSITPLRKSKE
jgi:hypothetical protein